ncbi:MAG: TetR family transcriptional regulator [Deltaproteobacteria bacterium]|nr:TetR family transcriptional regulator [Deltaproteobacteria bacterium]
MSSVVKKDETYWTVLNAAIVLDFERGHQRWTISDLSRKSKITRSLIYYYFGKSRSSILLEAVKLVGNEVFGFHEREMTLWREGKFSDSIVDAATIMAKSPQLGAFYLTHRTRDTEIGKLLQEMEQKYFEKLSSFFPDAALDDLITLFAMFLGFTLTPEIKKESLDRFVNNALKLVTKSHVKTPCEDLKTPHMNIEI